jgi:hypothetical protein
MFIYSIALRLAWHTFNRSCTWSAQLGTCPLTLPGVPEYDSRVCRHTFHRSFTYLESPSRDNPSTLSDVMKPPADANPLRSPLNFDVRHSGAFRLGFGMLEAQPQSAKVSRSKLSSCSGS